MWDCAVVGVPDERFGERPVAFAVADPALPSSPGVLADALLRHAQQHLGRLKRPDAIYLIEELPRSPTGKLLRRQLRTLLPKD